ncbi:hypothetical protein BDV93DRAFT_604624 [Ceratobasidium sp. AG-I]|nr:hypothetical protein BDV93DRAFT_604624 [Ceratobasidium sp. AG-I]
MVICSAVQSSPDIVGLGVRLAFYVQAFLCFFMSFKFPIPQDLTYRRTLQLTNCCLIVSAWIQYASEQSLSIVDTILVSMMSMMLFSCMFGASPGMTVYTTRFDPALCVISHIATSAWGIVIWVQIKGCKSDAVVVLFGRSISVANRGFQIFAIFFFTYVGCAAFMEIFPLLRSVYNSSRGSDIRNTLRLRRNDPSPRILWDLLLRRNPQLIISLEREGPEFMIRDDRKDNHDMWSFYSIFVWAVILASIEQTIQRNNQERAMSEWSFGQTLAVSVTLSSIVQARTQWKEHWPLIKGAKGTRGRLRVAFSPAWEPGLPTRKRRATFPSMSNEVQCRAT